MRSIFASMIFILLLSSATQSSEGIPLMVNYRHSQYRAETQNWSVAEDHRGFIYVANLSGVLEFDGSDWRLISLPGNMYATSLAIDPDGVIYVGSYSEFGILKPDNRGFLQYHSLLDKFPVEHREFSFIWKIVATDQGIFFSNYNNLFRLQNDAVTVWDITRLSSFFAINNEILVYDNAPDKGLLYLENDQLIRFDSDNSLAGQYISGIFPFGDRKLLLLSLTNGFLVADNRLCTHKSSFNLSPLPNQEVARYLRENIYTGGLQARNGKYIFSTQNAGIITMNADGSPESLLNESMGLQNETVNSLFEASNQILWLALDNGITSVKRNIELSYWSSMRGLKGSVLSIQKLNNNILAGTWQGIYRLNLRNNLAESLNSEQINFPASFSKFSEIDGIGWKIIPVRNRYNEVAAMLVATSEGLWFIHKNMQSRLIKHGHFYDIVQSQNDPEIIVVAGASGLEVFTFNDRELSLTSAARHDELKHYEVYRIIEDENLRFWLTHRNEGISLLSLRKQPAAGASAWETNIKHFNASHGLFPKGDVLAFSIGNQILFISENGLQKYQPYSPPNIKGKTEGKVQFVSVNYFFNLLLRRYFTVRFVNNDNQNNIWMQIQHRFTRHKKLIKLDYNPQTATYSLRNNSYNFFSGSTINDIYIENGGSLLWFAADDAVFRLQKTDEQSVRNFSSHLRAVRINNTLAAFGPEQIAEAGSLKEDLSFSYKENNISFKYTIANFFDPGQSLFSTKLEGMEHEWSSWSSNTERHYTSLPPGRYNFLVKGLDSFGNESAATEFHFRIKAPFYLRSWAFVLYALIIMASVIIITRIVNKNLIRTKIKLEAKVLERTREIEEKQMQIEQERQKADQLLQNILPSKIATELKTKGNVKVQYYDLVTIMFMDFKDFSKISQFINPLALISELNNSFCVFDEIAQKHRMEKIKTIGDAYMCAGGIPEPNLTNPFNAILSAFEVLNFIQNAEKEQWLCDVRIGIHTGEIMAGVIGKNKFAYDIWGESVNTASRMEQKGEVNRINISGETYELVKNFFKCEYRGKLEAKHQNQFDMYFVNRILPEYSKDSKGTVANDKFWADVNKYLSKIPIS